MPIKIRHHVPRISAFSEERLNELENLGHHPAIEEIHHSYLKGFIGKVDIKPGDIIEFSSEQYHYVKYYYVSIRGIEYIQ